MDKGQIIKYLDNYKHVPAMIETKKLQIADLEDRLQFARENRYIDHEKSEIRSTGISKPTEKTAIMDLDGYATPAEKELSRQLYACRSDLRALEHMPKYVDAWLGGLHERERLIIGLHHFDRMTFDRIGSTVGFDASTIKRIYKQAIGKIERIACY